MKLQVVNSPFNEQQVELLNQLLPKLTAQQKIWLNGYLSAPFVSEEVCEPLPVAAEVAKKDITILYASQTGNSQRLAEKFAASIDREQADVTVASMANFKVNNLKKLAVFGTVSVVGFFAVLVIIGFLVMLFDHSPSKGYYNYNGTTYYNISGDSNKGWYYYDSYDDWAPIDASSVPSDIKETPSANDFFYTPDWDSETQITDFESTEIYQEYQEAHSYSNSDDSSDYDWSSSDSWDSDSSDWGSDW